MSLTHPLFVANIVHLVLRRLVFNQAEEEKEAHKLTGDWKLLENSKNALVGLVMEI